MERFQRFKEPGVSNRPMPFWFLNHRLERDELKRQIGELRDQGCGGFILHARHGLLTPYLSGEWMDSVRYCIEEGNRLGLRVWLYDEDNWPSGTASGRVTDLYPEYRQITLGLTAILDTVPGESLEWNNDAGVDAASVLGIKDDGDAENLSALYDDNRVRGTVPEGVRRVLIFDARPTEGGFHRYYLDTLNAAAVAEFVHATHAWYQEALGETANLVEGIFTDEPRFGALNADRIPWTAALPERFEQQYGYSISKALPSLVLPGEGEAIVHRCRFHRCVQELYYESYFDTIGQTCRELGWLHIGHPEFEGELAKHPWTEGDFFQLSERLDYAGCDALHDSAWPREGFCNNLLALKLASSAAALLGKPAMVEAFGLAKGWNLSLADLARLSGFQLACGIDTFVPHAAYYSIEGFRKWECPPAQSYQQPFWPWYRLFTDSLSRYTTLLSGGVHVASALMLYPLRSFQGLFSLDPTDIERRKALENRISELCEQFMRYHCDFDFIPEEYLTNLTLDDEKRFVYAVPDGRRIIFPTLVLPACRVLSEETFVRLERWANEGARILFIDTIPDAAAETGSSDSIRATVDRWVETYDALEWVDENGLGTFRYLTEPGIEFDGEAGDIVFRHVLTDEGDVFFLQNTSQNRDYRLNVTLPCPGRYVYEVDAENGGLSLLPVTGPNPIVPIAFQPGETYAIVITNEPIPDAEEKTVLPESPRQVIQFEREFVFFTRDGNYLPLTAWQMHSEPVRQEPADWLGYRRVYSASFWVNETCEPMYLLCDGLHHQEAYDGHGKKEFTIAINGEQVGAGEEGAGFDRLLVRYDITESVRLGANRVTISSTAHFHDPGHITEALYIQGDFTLRNLEDKLIISRPGTIVHLGSWAEQGYPYYSGTAVYRQRVHLPESIQGSRARLYFEPVNDLVEIRINEKKAGVVWRAPWAIDVSEAVLSGNNLFEFRVVNTLDNLFLRRETPSGLCGDIVLEVY